MPKGHSLASKNIPDGTRLLYALLYCIVGWTLTRAPHLEVGMASGKRVGFVLDQSKSSHKIILRAFLYVDMAFKCVQFGSNQNLVASIF